MEISRKSVVIASSIIALAGLGFLAYSLLNEQSEEGGAWFNSSWMYRRSLDVENTGSTLTNEDVLVVLDTGTLITNNKLQSDCDDLRFVDSDDSTLLKYWVEGGCNTTSTQIWVQIPSLPNGGKTIYVYYGNDSATNAEETWSGDFILLADDSCPSGWTRESAFDGKFPYGSTSYGTDFDGQHNHSQASCTTGTASGTTKDGADDDSPNCDVALRNHTHSTARVDISNSVIDPPHIGLYFCRKSKLEHFPSSIGIFNISSPSSLPSPFSHYTTLNDKYPKGSSAYVASGGSDTHTHNTVGGYNTGTSSAGDSKDCDNTTTAKLPHYHTTINGSTGAGNNNIPYFTVIYAQTSSLAYGSAGIVEMVSAIPPLGWNQFSELDNKFPKGSAAAGTSYAGATHTHSVTISTGNANASQQGVYWTTGTSFIYATHTHSCTTTSSTATALPPYRTTIFSQRKSSLNVTASSNPGEEMYNQTPNAPSSLLTEGATNPTGITDLTPEFSAVYTDPDTGDTATHYQVQVNTSSDFTGTSMWDSTKTLFGTALDINDRSPDISYNGSTLQWGSTYYWRIKFWDNNDFNNEGPWSTGGQFTTNYKPNQPSTPYTSGSANPAKTTLTPTFSAIFSDTDTPDTGNSYQIQVNTSSDFSGTSMWDSTKTAFSPAVSNNTRSSNITYNGSSFAAGTQYFWRIMFWDNNDLESTWSTTSNFITAGPPQNPSALLTEGRVNPVTIVAGYPNFSAFYTDPNGDSATYYEIEINSSPTFTGTVMWDTGKTATSITSNTRSPDYTYDGVPLTNTNNIYYWRIRFWDSDDTVSDWSSTAQFTDKFTHLIIDGLQLKGVKIN